MAGPGCHTCGYRIESISGFCPRCGDRSESGIEDAASRALRALVHAVRGKLWLQDRCLSYLQKLVESIVARPPARSKHFAVYQALIAALIDQRGPTRPGAWSSVLQCCLQLAQIEGQDKWPSIVDGWRILDEEFQQCQNLLQSLSSLKDSLTAKSLEKKQLLANLGKVSSQTGYSQDHIIECIRSESRLWPRLAIGLGLMSKEQAQHDAFVAKAHTQIREENYEVARQLLKTVLDEVPNHVRALETMAGLHWRTDRRPEAIKCLRRAILSSSASPVLWNNYAWYVATAGDVSQLPEASQFAELACAAMPTVGYFDTLAECRERTGDLAAAIEATRIGLTHDPDHPGLRTRFARLIEIWNERQPHRRAAPGSGDGSSLWDDDEDFSMCLDVASDDDLVLDDDVDCDFEELAPAQKVTGTPERPTATWEAFAQRFPSSQANADRGVFATVDGHTLAAARRDPVDCTVFAPPQATAGDAVLIQVFVHRPEQADQAARAAIEFDDEARRRGVTSLGTQIARGSMLTFELSLKGAAIDEPVQQLTWKGITDSVQFGVEIPPELANRSLIGTVMVSQDSVPIGTIRFKLKVAGGQDGAPSLTTQPVGNAQRFRRAFVSYASGDRAEVLRRVQMLNAVGIQFFQDVMDLDPGQRWEQALYRHIDESDVMFLFWSSRAKESPWVARECQYAREQKGEDFIRPVIIEGPPIIPPPPELAHLHFNDRILYFLHDA